MGDIIVFFFLTISLYCLLPSCANWPHFIKQEKSAPYTPYPIGTKYGITTGQHQIKGSRVLLVSDNPTLNFVSFIKK